MNDYEVTFVTKVYNVYRITADDEFEAAQLVEEHRLGQHIETYSDGEEEFVRTEILDA